MGTKIYVGNLSFNTNAETVRALFADHGDITEVFVATDRDTGQPRGFAFVTMATSAAADKAIRENDGKMVDGRALRVNVAQDRPRGGFQGGGAGGRSGSRF